MLTNVHQSQCKLPDREYSVLLEMYKGQLSRVPQVRVHWPFPPVIPAAGKWALRLREKRSAIWTIRKPLQHWHPQCVTSPWLCSGTFKKWRRLCPGRKGTLPHTEVWHLPEWTQPRKMTSTLLVLLSIIMSIYYLLLLNHTSYYLLPPLISLFSTPTTLL